MAEPDDDSGREAGRFGEQLVVAVEVSGRSGEPLVDRVELAELPRGVGVVAGGRSEGEPLGGQGVLEHWPARGSFPPGRRFGGVEVDEHGSMSRSPASAPVELCLVVDRSGEGAGAVTIAG